MHQNFPHMRFLSKITGPSSFSGHCLERFRTSSANAKRFQMDPEVTNIEEEGVLNYKNTVFCGIWRMKY